jgi:hypothetical protein
VEGFKGGCALLSNYKEPARCIVEFLPILSYNCIHLILRPDTKNIVWFRLPDSSKFIPPTHPNFRNISLTDSGISFSFNNGGPIERPGQQHAVFCRLHLISAIT